MDLKSYIKTTKLSEGQIALFYTGQEGFIVKCNDKYVLIDGYLSDYVDKNCCSEAVKWVRKYPSPISGDELDFIDYVFCTHAHYDHADPETLSKLGKSNKNAKFIVPNPIVDVIEGYGIEKDRIIGAYDMVDIALDGITVTPIASAHEELCADENGEYANLGYRIDFGCVSLYHAGDCCLYDGLDEKVGNVDIAMLPVNGRSYYKLKFDDIIGNMDVYEATRFTTIIKAKMLIPMHFDLYAVNGISTSSVVDGIESVNSDMAYHIFKPAERYIFAR